MDDQKYSVKRFLKNIAIFGDADISEADETYKATFDVAEELAKRGFNLVLISRSEAELQDASAKIRNKFKETKWEKGKTIFFFVLRICFGLSGRAGPKARASDFGFQLLLLRISDLPIPVFFLRTSLSPSPRCRRCASGSRPPAPL